MLYFYCCRYGAGSGDRRRSSCPSPLRAYWYCRIASAFALFCLISVQAERTFERLRYFLGGDRPSQTAHLTMSPASIQRRRLEFQCRKDGIPTSAPESPKRSFPRVPSILCMQHRNPLQKKQQLPYRILRKLL